MSGTPVWIDGRLVDASDAVVPVDDHGLTVGDGVFETVKLSDGAPFELARHLDRFERSAEGMRLPAPDRDDVEAAITAVVDAHNATSTDGADAFLRLTLTGGPGPFATPRGELEPRLIVAVRPGRVRIEPTEVIVAPWTRNEHGALTGVKSTSYGENVVALALAAEHGASEALFANTSGKLCEGTGSNVFVVVDGRLVTPPLASGCLAGVTRALLLESGVGTEADVEMAELGSATEAFLVSTAREVQPIAAIDGVPLPAAPGPFTAAARQSWVDRYA